VGKNLNFMIDWLEELDTDAWRVFNALERVNEGPETHIGTLLNRGTGIAFKDPRRALYAKLKWSVES